MNTIHGWTMLVAQVGPTELIVPEGSATHSGGVPAWIWLGLAIVLVVVIGAWARGFGQSRVDPRELAFRSLAKKLGLSRRQIAGIRTMSRSQGLGSPVGLLLSPSAVRASVGTESSR